MTCRALPWCWIPVAIPCSNAIALGQALARDEDTLTAVGTVVDDVRDERQGGAHRGHAERLL